MYKKIALAPAYVNGAPAQMRWWSIKKYKIAKRINAKLDVVNTNDNVIIFLLIGMTPSLLQLHKKPAINP